MQELIRVAVDAMGGDNAPAEIVKGAVEALKASTDLKVILVGQEEAVQQELSKYQYDASRMEVVNATEIIEMAEPPVQANPFEEGFFNRCCHEAGKKWRSRCIWWEQAVQEQYWLEDSSLLEDLKEWKRPPLAPLCRQKKELHC